ncbi:MAG: polyphosphate kinase 2 family protein [Gammaproteobacteria bacterium]|nr:polyphosphate kinase 2 family protein [Gammaproteobacteria bacterium]
MSNSNELFHAIDSPYLAAVDGSFAVALAPTAPPSDAQSPKDYKRELNRTIKELQALQSVLYASGANAVLLIFQAMDAAGKDSTIRAVMTGINPAGCKVYSFKQPSDRELAHDFLWRTYACMPEKGRIGIFNRSYYEEVLVVRVHPEMLASQNLPRHTSLKTIWQERYESICDVERHLARNGTVILKFWLNVSQEEQKRRFLRRIKKKEKHWKWSPSDLHEREYWDDYMAAYEHMIRMTSRSWAPWYTIPADNKPFMHYSVANIIKESLQSLELKYPSPDADAHQHLAHARKQLLED